MTRLPVADTLIRIALTCWLTDPMSGLSVAQQTWLRTRLAHTTALTAQERTKLSGPLLAWAQHRMPIEAWERLRGQVEGMSP